MHYFIYTLVWFFALSYRPQKDLGYDISDYKQVHEPYGNVEDAEAIVRVTHSSTCFVVPDEFFAID